MMARDPLTPALSHCVEREMHRGAGTIGNIIQNLKD